jgi:hypothetical protein
VFVSVTVSVLPLDTNVTRAARLPDEPENVTLPADAVRKPNPIAATAANAKTEKRVIRSPFQNDPTSDMEVLIPHGSHFFMPPLNRCHMRNRINLQIYY